MSFNSVQFLFFFPVVAILYFILNHKYRWLLMLVASYTFYMYWNPLYAFLILGSTVVDYFSAIKLFGEKNDSKRKRWLYLSLFVNLGLLFLFKYLGFFQEICQDGAAIFGLNYDLPIVQFLLPVGISFYTFQTLSYTIDVYDGAVKPETHFGRFALYVCFFPQLVAGPIERAVNLLPQFRERIKFDYERIVSGLFLMGFGLFKKVVIADTCGSMVKYYYSHMDELYGVGPGIMSVTFVFQVYFDFSAYSDIAIGAALVLGFTLMDNFKSALHARSLPTLWQRWHISLTSWFRDYMFKRLAKNTRNRHILFFYLFLIFFVSGVWHGASWTFVLWGTMHGVIVVFYKYTQKWRKKISKKKWYAGNERVIAYVETVITFLIFGIVGVLFSSNSVAEASYIWKSMATDFLQSVKVVLYNTESKRMAFLYLGKSSLEFVFLIVALVAVLTIERYQLLKGSFRAVVRRQKPFIRWSLYLIIIFSVVLYSVQLQQPFIYFQF